VRWVDGKRYDAYYLHSRCPSATNSASSLLTGSRSRGCQISRKACAFNRLSAAGLWRPTASRPPSFFTGWQLRAYHLEPANSGLFLQKGTVSTISASRALVERIVACRTTARVNIPTLVTKSGEAPWRRGALH